MTDNIQLEQKVKNKIDELLTKMDQMEKHRQEAIERQEQLIRRMDQMEKHRQEAIERQEQLLQRFGFIGFGETVGEPFGESTICIPSSVDDDDMGFGLFD